MQNTTPSNTTSYNRECKQVLQNIQQDDWTKTHGHMFNQFYYKPR